MRPGPLSITDAAQKLTIFKKKIISFVHASHLESVAHLDADGPRLN
jgi:hypothetical protein